VSYSIWRLIIISEAYYFSVIFLTARISDVEFTLSLHKAKGDGKVVDAETVTNVAHHIRYLLFFNRIAERLFR
jgi:hypothetical protein